MTGFILLNVTLPYLFPRNPVKALGVVYGMGGFIALCCFVPFHNFGPGRTPRETYATVHSLFAVLSTLAVAAVGMVWNIG